MLVATLALALLTLALVPPTLLAYLDIVCCFVLSAIGTSSGIAAISKYVSGTAVRHPRVGTKAILGTVVCEANFLSGIISCVLVSNTLRESPALAPRGHYILFTSSIFVGLCSLFSSVATGTICGVISLMDGKDELLFFKVVVLEVIPASVGLIGFILGIVMSSKV